MFHVKQFSMKEINKCKICDGSDFKLFLKTQDYFYTREEFSLSKCNNCGFVFTNPIPENLGRYYDTEEYLSHDTANVNIISKIYGFIRNLNISRKYNIVSSYVPRGTILDIGCGTGELLAFFKKKGWKTKGVEPNQKARHTAISNNNVDVIGEDEINQIDPESQDVVSMWHVLEHIEELNTRIEQVKGLTSKNGLMIFALPNLNSPDSKKYGKHWAGLDVPRHLYHFTEDSFSRLMDKHNLRLIKSIPMKFDAYYVSMLSEKYLKNSFGIIRAIFSGFSSNTKAKKNNNYSSMIFVVKKV